MSNGTDEMALAEIDRAIAAGVRFGCVLTDAGYGLSAPFRQGLTARKLTWAVGIPRHLKVYPADVRMSGRLPSAVVPGSGTFLTFYRYRRRYSRCRSAISKHFCERSRSKLFVVYAGGLARSCQPSVAQNAAITSDMPAMRPYNRNLL
jgi:hypothetical protein